MGRGRGVCEPGLSCYAKLSASRHPDKTRKSVLTMHDWEAKHYVIAAVIILVVMGMFAYSWS